MTLRPPETLRLLVENIALDDESNSMRIATPVLGHDHWNQMANAVNWLVGHGGTVVCGNNTLVTVPGSSSVTLQWYNFSTAANTTYLADQQVRIWIVQMTCTVFASGTVTCDESSTQYQWSAKRQSSTQLSDQILIFPEIPAATPAEDIGLTFTNSSATDAYIVGVSCHEVPLYLLQENDGVHESTLRAGAVISDQELTLITGGNDKSIKGVYDRFLRASATASKRCLFSWCNPSGVTITSSTLTNLFRIDPAMSARHLGSTTADQQRSVTVAAYCVLSGTTPTGEVDFTATSGGNVTLSITDTSGVYTWFTDTFLIDTDDPTRYATDGGIRGGTRDDIAITARKTAGTDITVKSISIGFG